MPDEKVDRERKAAAERAKRPWQFGDALDWIYSLSKPPHDDRVTTGTPGPPRPGPSGYYPNVTEKSKPSRPFQNTDQSGSVFQPAHGNADDPANPYAGTVVRLTTRERGQKGDTTSQTPTAHSRTSASASHARNIPAHKRPATTGGANSNVVKDTSAADQALLGGGPRPGETPPQEPGDYGFGSPPSPTQAQLANFPVAAGGLGLAGNFGQGGPQSNQPEMRASTAPTVNEALANMGPISYGGGPSPGPSAGATRPRSVYDEGRYKVGTQPSYDEGLYKVGTPATYEDGRSAGPAVAAGGEQAAAPPAHHGASAFLMKFLQAIAGGGQHDRSGTGKAPGEAFGQPNAVQQGATRRRAEFSQMPQLSPVQYQTQPQAVDPGYGGMPAQLPDMMQFSPPVPPNPTSILLGAPQMPEEMRRRMMGM